MTQDELSLTIGQIGRQLEKSSLRSSKHILEIKKLLADFQRVHKEHAELLTSLAKGSL